MVLLVFGKYFSNYLQIPSKYSNLMLSICKISLRKNNMIGADEDGQMLFLQNELLLYIFKCKWNRETGLLLTKISSFVSLITSTAA